MKMAKKMLVLAIVATGTLMGSTGTSSALADVGGHLLVQNTGTVNPNGKKGTKKTSTSRKRRGQSARAKNAERRQQRQLKRQRERDLDEFRRVAAEILEDVIAGRAAGGGRAQQTVREYQAQRQALLDEAIEMSDDDLGELLELLVVAVEEGDAELLAIDVIGEPDGDDGDGCRLYLVIIILVDDDGDGDWDRGGVLVIRLR